jgi:hypothetical protein
MAKPTPNFHRQLVVGAFRWRVIKCETLGAVLKVQIFLMENSSPLEWCTYRYLYLLALHCSHMLVIARAIESKKLRTMLGLTIDTVAEFGC